MFGIKEVFDRLRGGDPGKWKNIADGEVGADDALGELETARPAAHATELSFPPSPMPDGVRTSIAKTIQSSELADAIRRDPLNSVLAEGVVNDSVFVLVATRWFVDSDTVFIGDLKVYMQEDGKTDIYDFKPACATLERMESLPGAGGLLARFKAAHDFWLENHKNTSTNTDGQSYMPTPMPGSLHHSL